jgi:hypothetical protein
LQLNNPTSTQNEYKKITMKTNYWFNRNRLLSGLRFGTALLLVLSVLFISASSSQAERAQTYHGTLTGGTFLCDGTPVNGPIVTGTWNVIIDPRTPAQVTLNVFYNGGHHLAFGYNALMQVSFVNGVYIFSGFGDAAAATLDTTNPATFSWRVELGVSCPDQNPYNSLTYFGVADRGGR